MLAYSSTQASVRGLRNLTRSGFAEARPTVTRQATRLLPFPCGEQHSAAHRQRFRAEERTSMSEQKKSSGYMQELDKWTQENVLDPLFAFWPEVYMPHPMTEGEMEDATEKVKKAIREKVLESYHNGKAARDTGAHKRLGYAKR
jgi:hypothetical protein